MFLLKTGLKIGVSALPESNPLHLTQAGRGQTHSWTSSVGNLGCSALNGSLHLDSHSCKHKQAITMQVLYKYN